MPSGGGGGGPIPSGGGGGGPPKSGGGGGASSETLHGAGVAVLFLRRGADAGGGACGAPGGAGAAPSASAPGPEGIAGGTFAENVWSFNRMLAASRRDCPLISDCVPVTVIFSPLRTAEPSCPPRTGATSTTLPF